MVVCRMVLVWYRCVSYGVYCIIACCIFLCGIVVCRIMLVSYPCVSYGVCGIVA